MKLKILLLFIVGIITYLLLTAAVLLFYKDDPEQMTWQDREAFNAKLINKMDIIAETIQQDDVIERLGVPDITAAIQHDNTVYQLLYYRTQWKLADGITTKDECTPLLFKERQLIAKGDEAVEHYKAITGGAIF